MFSPLDLLIQQLAKLPGIGEKTATRLAFYLVRAEKSEAETLATSLLKAIRETRFCSFCQTFTGEDPCKICRDQNRNKDLLLVVEGPEEIRAIEQGKGYRGFYHVLHGVLSPLDRVGPEDLKIKELIQRVANQNPHEVILATSTRVEGEATALYLTRLLKPLGVKLSRIAMGIPMGGDLEYIDALTLQRAIEGRREV